MADPVSLSRLKSSLSASQKVEADQAYAIPGTGLAVFSNGTQKLLITYGARSARISGYPPAAMSGGYVLTEYCEPDHPEATKMSPLMAASRGDTPQIAAPPRGTPSTVYPGR